MYIRDPDSSANSIPCTNTITKLLWSSTGGDTLLLGTHELAGVTDTWATGAAISGSGPGCPPPAVAAAVLGNPPAVAVVPGCPPQSTSRCPGAPTGAPEAPQYKRMPQSTPPAPVDVCVCDACHFLLLQGLYKENDFIKPLAFSYHWIGLFRNGINESWVWEDGTALTLNL
ncbi:hypothetical protein UY3_16100 [Chelonia mydas]|uniref:Uncharacterized protein n=1 Tax=Chelonia mydas TaxID=8469 RepID=M7BF33_CHEMY|nr:hypothetical protein UY3_16100 [Chelonia mydas]